MSELCRCQGDEETGLSSYPGVVLGLEVSFEGCSANTKCPQKYISYSTRDVLCPRETLQVSDEKSHIVHLHSMAAEVTDMLCPLTSTESPTFITRDLTSGTSVIWLHAWVTALVCDE